MNSPSLQSVIIAVVLAVVAYFVAAPLQAQAPETVLAATAFISALVAVVFSGSSANDASDAEEDIRTLYVGNLPYRANETAVRELFSEHGNVHSVRLMKDKHTGKRRGFGFVEMAAADLDNAISSLNDTEFQQRTLKVREAKERPERSEPNEE